MDSTALREKLAQTYLRQVEDTEFPSRAIMDRAEQAIGSSEQLGDYAELLMKKMDTFMHPSADVLRRLDRIADKLEQAERQHA